MHDEYSENVLFSYGHNDVSLLLFPGRGDVTDQDAPWEEEGRGARAPSDGGRGGGAGEGGGV